MGDRLSKRVSANDERLFDNSWFQMTLIKADADHEIEGVKHQVHFIKSSVSSNFQVHLCIEKEDLAHKNCGKGKYRLNIEALWNNFAKEPTSEFQQFCVQVLTKIPVEFAPMTLN